MTVLGRVVAKLKQIAYCRRTRRLTSDVVLSGPFKGMKYRPSRRIAYCPKLLGTYELELNDTIESACRRGFRRIVNVGAAEGYYAVGLALRLSGAEVVAYEADAGAARLMLEMSVMNGVAHRVDIRGMCTVEGLRNSLRVGDSTLLLMDVEGDERTLLDPSSVPALRAVTILVEVHDFVSEQIAPEIRERFAGSHSLQEVWSRPRSLEDYPVTLGAVEGLGRALALSSMDEGRPGRMRWFILSPKGDGA